VQEITRFTDNPTSTKEAVPEFEAIGGVVKLRCQWNAEIRKEHPKDFQNSSSVSCVDIDAAQLDWPCAIGAGVTK
jgi:hypothetical protein